MEGTRNQEAVQNIFKLKQNSMRQQRHKSRPTVIIIARGCVKKWSDALSTAVLTELYMRDITDCSRSVRDIPTPCGDRQHWLRWTTRGRCRGLGERWECPTTMHPMGLGGSVSKSLVGTIVDEIVRSGS